MKKGTLLKIWDQEQHQSRHSLTILLLVQTKTILELALVAILKLQVELEEMRGLWAHTVKSTASRISCITIISHRRSGHRAREGLKRSSHHLRWSLQTQVWNLNKLGAFKTTGDLNLQLTMSGELEDRSATKGDRSKAVQPLNTSQSSLNSVSEACKVVWSTTTHRRHREEQVCPHTREHCRLERNERNNILNCHDF